MLLEAERYADRLRPETVFFGGGTPSALSTSQLEFLLGGLRERVDFSGVREWTLEMNPATVSAEKARALLDLGVTRISMGVQAWDDASLKTLGRVHNAAQAQRSYEILRESGVPEVNLDLIFGVPGQTREQWCASLERTVAMQPDHISAYCLTYEEDTDFFLRVSRGEWVPDESLDAELFEITMETLAAGGFQQYEISNYAHDGRVCRHNIAYWTGADYVGLGPSAFSTVGANRWKNVSDTEAYVARIMAGERAADFEESLDEETRIAERLAFSLRTDAGASRDELMARNADTERMVAEGLLEPVDGRLRLTRAGRMVADAVAEAFV